MPYTEAGSRPLASIVTAEIMPLDDVTERTQVTRNIGAATMLDTLMSGDWELHVREHPDAVIEMLSRIVQNAKRHGIET